MHMIISRKLAPRHVQGGTKDRSLGRSATSDHGSYVVHRSWHTRDLCEKTFHIEFPLGGYPRIL